MSDKTEEKKQEETKTAKDTDAQQRKDIDALRKQVAQLSDQLGDAAKQIEALQQAKTSSEKFITLRDLAAQQPSPGRVVLFGVPDAEPLVAHVCCITGDGAVEAVVFDHTRRSTTWMTASFADEPTAGAFFFPPRV